MFLCKWPNSARVQIITSPIVNSIINIWYGQVSKRGRHFNLRILSYWRSITKDIWCCCLVKASYFPLIYGGYHQGGYPHVGHRATAWSCGQVELYGVFSYLWHESFLTVPLSTVSANVAVSYCESPSNLGAEIPGNHRRSPARPAEGEASRATLMVLFLTFVCFQSIVKTSS